jgi:potassium efflux system protein
MDWDLSAQPPIVQTAVGYAIRGYEIALGWLLSPAAWSQFALLILAYFAAVVLTRRIRPVLTRVLTPPEESISLLSRLRRGVLMAVPLLLPVLAYMFAAIGEQVTRSIFGTGTVIAFGKGVFLFLAARVLVRDIVSDPFLKLLGRYVLLPVVALYAVGLLDLLTERLDNTIVSRGTSRSRSWRCCAV